jgi:uncharacterized protein DUF4432
MAQVSKCPSWADRIGNTAQVGGIETSVMDNGFAKGTRIAWFNTGSGLRYKVLIDRCLDIADTFYNQHSLVWLSHTGVTAPRPDANRGLVWLESFSGGLVTTCGLTHIGSPEKSESDQRGLHGRISNIPAEIESIVQPEPRLGKMEMSITAKIIESSVFGPSLQLRRTISSKLEEPTIKICDQVTNIGNDKAPHMLLYHCNFGFPMVDKGTEIVCNGEWKSRGLSDDEAIFNSRHNYKKCPAPMEAHSGTGEAGAFVSPRADRNGMCLAGLYNYKLKLAVKMKFSKKQLPCLSNWQHWGKGEYVTGLEPGTNFPVGQEIAKKQKKLIYLSPGESRTYDLQIEVLTGKNDIQSFLKIAR